VRLVFLGAPGVGKGTQATRLAQERGVPHIATGDMLRSAVARATQGGIAAKSHIDAGRLVPDSVVIGIVLERLSEPDAAAGYILDGFPRTVVQADALAEMLGQRGATIDRVVYFSLDEEALVERIAGRRVCPACQAVYHMTHYPSRRAGFCDCGAALAQRKDDAPETVKVRLAAYRSETMPLIQYYETRGLLSHVEARGGIDEIAGRVKQAAGLCP